MGGEKRKQLPKLAMPNSVFSHLWVVLVILLPTLCQGKNNILQTKVLFVFANFDHCHSGHQIFISNSTSVMLTTTNSYLILSSKFIIPQQSKLFPSFLFVSVAKLRHHQHTIKAEKRLDINLSFLLFVVVQRVLIY